ncbi:hypothetical protein D3C76_719790 [compost metagenome]
MIGVRGRGRVEGQDVPGIALAVHDRPPDVTGASPRGTGLHEKHRLDAGLHRIDRQAVEHGLGRVPETRGAGAIVERQQKADRWLRAQSLFGLRRHFNGCGDTAQQTGCHGEHR